MKLLSLPLRCLAVLSCVAGLTLTAHATQSEILVEGGGVAIRADDVRADAQRIPEASRSSLLSRPDQVGQMAQTLFQRRLLAAEAQKAGLAADPVVAAAVQIAQDRVLSEAMLARIDAGNTPDSATMDAYARDTYKIEAQRFQRPDEIRARHILISIKQENARAQAEQILAQLRGGADFERLAREKSDDKGSAAKGGDLGFFGKGRMVPQFEQAAFALQPGQFSDIVESQFGFHIIQLTERRAAGQRAFEEVREQLRQDAAAKAIRTGRETLVRRLDATAKPNEAAIRAWADTQR